MSIVIAGRDGPAPSAMAEFTSALLLSRHPWWHFFVRQQRNLTPR